MKYFKKLVGDRIYLSPRNTEDVEKFTEWLNDFNVTDYIGRSDALTTLDSEKKYLEDNSSSKYSFVIVTLDSDKMIGTVGLENISSSNRTATLGVFIGDKDYLSKGYGTEAIRLLLDYGFNYLNLHSINLTLMAFNERALKCYEKCGFKQTGKIRDHRFINGKFYDAICMDILEDEFNEEFIRNKNIKKN